MRECVSYLAGGGGGANLNRRFGSSNWGWGSDCGSSEGEDSGDLCELHVGLFGVFGKAEAFKRVDWKVELIDLIV